MVPGGQTDERTLQVVLSILPVFTQSKHFKCFRYLDTAESLFAHAEPKTSKKSTMESKYDSIPIFPASRRRVN